MAEAKAKMMMANPSSNATTAYRAWVRLPLALYSWITATVPAGALAGAMDPKIRAMGRSRVRRYTPTITARKAPNDSARMIGGNAHSLTPYGTEVEFGADTERDEPEGDFRDEGEVVEHCFVKKRHYGRPQDDADGHVADDGGQFREPGKVSRVESDDDGNAEQSQSG